MTILLFANQAQTTLAQPVTSSQTTITVASGTGVFFPAPQAGQAVKISLVNSTNNLITEVLLCTNITGNVLTVQRAQEGTIARSWAVGDFVINFMTAGTANAFVQTYGLENTLYSASLINLDTQTGNIYSPPTQATSLVNKAYADSISQGTSKAECQVATTENIVFFGLQLIDQYQTVAGDRVLVKNQTNPAENGIYVANASTWSRANDMSAWSQVPGASTFIQNGYLYTNTGWNVIAPMNGTLGVTPIVWTQFSGMGTYTAGIGLYLNGTQFNISNTGVTAGSYGVANSVPTIVFNAQGQVTSAVNTLISIAPTQINAPIPNSSLAHSTIGIGSDTVALGGSVSTLHGMNISGADNTLSSIGNSSLTNSSITINGNTVALGGSTTVTASTTGTLTIGTGLSGGSFNGSAPVTIAINDTGVVANSYGSASSVAGITVNAQGQLTAAATIPIAIANTQVSGLGTMSVQNANSVAITGGTMSGVALTLDNLDSTPIGANTAATGKFTTLEATSTVTLDNYTGYVYANGLGAISASTTIPTTSLSGTVTNAQLSNSSVTINGNSVSLGDSTTITAVNPYTLSFGTHLTGSSYNGSANVTLGTDATNANTASTIVARDASGDFNAGTITATLSGTATQVSNALTIGTGLSGTSYNGGSAVTIAIANTGTAGTYGSSYQVPVITTNAQGQVTGVTNTTINAVTLTTGTISSAPVGNTDIANKLYVDTVAQGLAPKDPVFVATTANITLSGEQTIDGFLTSSNRVLVKNQGTPSQNGIYISNAGAWSRSLDADTWNELVSAFVFVQQGNTQADTGWTCNVDAGGTLGVTPVTWVQFSGAGTYTAGTGLTLSGTVFSITNTAVTAGSYGSASNTLTATVNAQGQLTALAATPIAIANTQVSGLGTMSTQNANAVSITGGAIDGTTIGLTTPAAAKVTSLQATNTVTLAASTTSLIPLHFASGVQPTSPSQGDTWSESTGLYYHNSAYTNQINIGANNAGVLSQPVITVTGGGATIDASSVEAVLFSLPNWIGDYKTYVVAAATGLALVDNSANYLVVTYNAGTPIYSITQNVAAIDNSSIVGAALLWRNGSAVHYQPIDWGRSTASRLNRRLVQTNRYQWASGLGLGESTGSIITVSSGSLWYGVTQYNETSQTSASSNAEFWYHVGGVWTSSLVSVYDNTQYDNGTNLATLNNNQYGVNWVYRYVDGSGLPKIAYTLGTSSHNSLASAVAAPTPTPPTILSTMAILVGRIIVQKGAATATQIDSAFTQVFSGATVTEHNNLSGLQGGTANEYYHLTNTEYTGTGTGTFVRATSPTLTTPNLGTPSALTLTNATGLPNSGLVNSSITINGSTVSLGGSTTVTATATNSLTIGTGLSGTSYNGSSAVTIALANTAVAAGSYTNASITVDAQGRLTAASSGTAPVTSVSGTSGQITSTGGTTPVLALATTAVTAASYGSASSVGTFTVDAYGRLTAAATTAIAIANTQVSGLGTMSTQDSSAVSITGGSISGISLGTVTNNTIFSSTGAITLPVGTTAQQPTGAAGMLRFNSTTTQFEGYNGSSWSSVGGAAISNDTTTATNVYPLFASATTGTALTVYTSNAKYLYKPSTGELQSPTVIASNGVFVNNDTVSANMTIGTGTNGFSVGPLTVNSGVTLTVASGQRHVVI